MDNVMIDLETLSTAPDAAILSIGAVAFDPFTGELGEEFHLRVEFKNAVESGRCDTNTLKWWIGQESEAGKDVTSGTKTSTEVLEEFKAFLPDNAVVWGNGATFDISILEHAFMRTLKEDAPWKFWNVRDCRTVEAMVKGKDTKKNYVRNGIHHQALDDAIYQAEYISGMVMKLRESCPDEAPALKVVGNANDTGIPLESTPTS